MIQVGIYIAGMFTVLGIQAFLKGSTLGRKEEHHGNEKENDD